MKLTAMTVLMAIAGTTAHRASTTPSAARKVTVCMEAQAFASRCLLGSADKDLAAAAQQMTKHLAEQV